MHQHPDSPHQRSPDAFHARHARVHQEPGRVHGRHASAHGFHAPDHRFPCSDDQILSNNAGLTLRRSIHFMERSSFYLQLCMFFVDRPSPRVQAVLGFLAMDEVRVATDQGFVPRPNVPRSAVTDARRLLESRDVRSAIRHGKMKAESSASGSDRCFGGRGSLCCRFRHAGTLPGEHAQLR